MPTNMNETLEKIASQIGVNGHAVASSLKCEASMVWDGTCCAALLEWDGQGRAVLTPDDLRMLASNLDALAGELDQATSHVPKIEAQLSSKELSALVASVAAYRAGHETDADALVNATPGLADYLGVVETTYPRRNFTCEFREATHLRTDRGLRGGRPQGEPHKETFFFSRDDGSISRAVAESLFGDDCWARIP